VTSGWARYDISGFRGLGLNDGEESRYELLGRSFEYGFTVFLNGVLGLCEPHGERCWVNVQEFL
jgi:hypothetical protein